MTQTVYPLLPVLIVDDDELALRGNERILLSAGINNIITCQDSREVMGILSSQDIGIMLLDLSMPHISGEELLPQIAETYPSVPVLVVTGANEIETAVECMRAGAFDYLVKPAEKSRLLSSVQRAIELRELRAENLLLRERMLHEGLEHPEAFAAFITRDSALRAVFRYAETIARTARPVLITGETGVGKELIARAIHTLSERAGAFVAINVAGLDDTVFSDTLFGHARGAFTGADEIRRGLIEQAAAGTLFLDEIGDLSPASQVKLLRLLQEHEYHPLGSDVAKRTDARIIVATNHDLDALMADGRFRKDLYHRLHTHHIEIPPLRKRLDDVPLLTHYFLEEAAHTLGKKIPVPPDELFMLLATYHFPGNVRELESMIFDAVSQHESRMLSMDMFKARITKGRTTDSPPVHQAETRTQPSLFTPLDKLPTLKEASQMLVEEAMRRADDNQSIAAGLLGISRTALNKRLKHGEE